MGVGDHRNQSTEVAESRFDEFWRFRRQGVFHESCGTRDDEFFVFLCATRAAALQSFAKVLGATRSKLETDIDRVV
jgi:hypothetical protein